MIENHLFQFVSCVYVYHDNDKESSAIINDDSHLLHITKGNGRIRIGDAEEFCVSRGWVVAIPRRTPFYMSIKGGFEMLNLHYKMWFDNGEYMDQKLRLPYHFCPAYFEKCESELREIYSMQKQGKDHILKRAAAAYDIITDHLSWQELIKTNEYKKDDKIDKATQYLASPECLHFDIKKAAALSCLSISQLNRRFSKEFGASPHKFWEKQRLKNISVKLKYSDMTIGEIADEFNFSSPYYFSRWFKKNLSCSPSEFRNSKDKY